MQNDADIAVIEQVLKILDPLSAFTDDLASVKQSKPVSPEAGVKSHHLRHS